MHIHIYINYIAVTLHERSQKLSYCKESPVSNTSVRVEYCLYLKAKDGHFECKAKMAYHVNLTSFLLLFTGYMLKVHVGDRNMTYKTFMEIGRP